MNSYLLGIGINTVVLSHVVFGYNSYRTTELSYMHHCSCEQEEQGTALLLMKMVTEYMFPSGFMEEEGFCKLMVGRSKPQE